jgi:hypothetical protein
MNVYQWTGGGAPEFDGFIVDLDNISLYEEGGSELVANGSFWTTTDGWSGNPYNYDTWTRSLISVPEPSVAMLLGLPAIGLLRLRRGRKTED